MQFCLKGWARTAVAFATIIGATAAIQISQPSAFAQNATTGSINGVVMDSTGAVVPNASVTVKDMANGATLNLTSNADGRFTAPYLKPDMFQVSATAPGLQSTTTTVQILVGQQSALNVTVTPSASAQTVQVSANNAQLIDTQTSNTTTTFTTAQFRDLPMPGGDISTIAFTIPGVTVNAGGAYGNFSSDGLPGLANLVIINGADDNDPFLNLNNSGSSNLTLGQQEIAQASVVQNGYSVQYGRQAGVIETYVTKSGGNRVHGLLQYNYNSDGLNSNDFFNNQSGTPKSKAVSNQYAAQIGGPIFHNKLFFFADTEGLRYITPTSTFVNFPSAALQNTILNTIPAQSVPIYTTAFKTDQGAPSYALAQPVTNGSGPQQDRNNLMGCGSYATTPVFGVPGEYFGSVPTNPDGTPGTGTAISCANSYHATGANLNKEYLITGRVDWNVSDKHKVFVRVVADRGQQPTFTSVINPALDAQSIQPTTDGQLNDTYSLTPNLTNQFIMSGLYYSAIFTPASIPATLAVSPTALFESTDGGSNSRPGFGQSGYTGFPWLSYPQGRNVTQYQFIDDLSWLKGNHNIKFGFNFKRDDVTDVGNEAGTFGGRYTFGSLADFAGGSLPGTAGSSYAQNFANVRAAYTALYNVGIYAQDEWRATPRLVIDYGLRVDRNGNPLCTNNCFSHYVGGFPAAGATLDTPYSTTISVGHGSAFPSVEKAIVQPRAGFNWDTKGDGKTVLRGGVGLFADLFPGVILSNEYGTYPSVFAPSVSSGVVGTGPGSAAAGAAASFAAINAGFAQGAGANQLANSLPAGVAFSAPSYYTTANTFKSPRYLEWSMQLQHQIGPADAVIVSYAGNHGYDLLIPNANVNQNLGGTTLANGSTLIPASAYTSFDGVPAASPDPRFGTVTQITNSALSDYNGISIQYKHIDRRGLAFDVAYTYSHALDDISNGGAGQYYNLGAIVSQITPNSASALMYSNADYDVRHNLVADLTYVEPNHFQNKLVDFAAAGWTIAGKAYWRTGNPFSVINSNAENDLFNGTNVQNVGSPGVVLADVLNNHFNHTCNSLSSPCFQTPGIFNGSGAILPAPAGPGGVPAAVPGDQVGNAPPQTNFGNVPRNAFFGPHYADVDVSVYKTLVHFSTAQFQIGAQAYNVLNHPNFQLPSVTGNNDASNPGALGVLSGDVTPPTSPYGSFQGSAVSGRVLVVQGRLTF